ncbi:phosphoribosylglycinamide formyltransferase [bacterium]|nr:phosphoribosylglycinamide formyltransferase [bacterium]
MRKIAVFASGSGSNAENIIKYFRNRSIEAEFIILTNSTKAYVIERAKQLDVPCYTFNRKDFYDNDRVLGLLSEHHIDFVVLAGFLLLVPESLINAYEGMIVNIHPALLPKYGGKGMYGMNVHQAVVDNHEKETGITIHQVNSKYDEGNVIFQAKCEVNPSDSADDVAQKIHKLEYEHFPKVIETILK